MKLKIAKSTRAAVCCATLATCAVLLVGRAHAGTWTAPSNMNPAGTGNCFLLSDGTILDDNGGQQIAILHPDASGNYTNGTWTIVTSPSPYYSWCSPDALLSDGTFMKFGGEYGPGNESAAEIYNPLNGSWTLAISPVATNVYDTFDTVEANGIVLNNSLYSTETYNYQTCSWTNIVQAPNWGDEANVELLPDGDIVDPLWLMQYSPSLNSWTTIPTPPISNTGDPGPTISLYNGTVLFESTGDQMAYYTPSTTSGTAGTWLSTIITNPNGNNYGDTEAVLEINGDVLISDGGGGIYELNPSTNSMTAETGGGTPQAMLPNGQVLANNGYVYTSTGTPASSLRPTVTSVSAGTGGGSGISPTYTLTGTQLFGRSQCGTDNDDVNLSTNIPIVYLKNTDTANGTDIYYCRSFNYSTRSIASGATGTISFTLPPGVMAGTYNLYVAVNGISSATAKSFTAPSTIDLTTTTFTANHDYYLSPSSGPGYLLNSYNGGNTPGNVPVDCSNNKNSDDDWIFTSNSNGTYTIRDSAGLVLDGNGVTTSGAAIDNTSNGGSNQQWNITSLGSGLFKITNNTSGLCLDGGTTPTNVKAITQDAYTGATGQKWYMFDGTVTPIVSAQRYGLYPSSGGQFLLNSYSGGGTIGQTPIDCSNTASNDDYWQFTQNTNGTYTITDDGGLVIDGNGVTTSGPPIENTNLSNSHQQWIVTNLGAGLYKITNSSSGLALDGGAAPVNLQNVTQDAYTGAAGQKWHLFGAAGCGFIVTYMPGYIPDWSSSGTNVPQSADLLAGGSMSFPVTVLPNTYNMGSIGTVTFSATGLPTGMTASFSPATLTGAGTTTCTISATSATTAGTYTVGITGKGSGLSAGVIEAQAMHVNVQGTTLNTGNYAPINEAEFNFGSTWQPYMSIDSAPSLGNNPIQQPFSYGNTNQDWTFTKVGTSYSMINVTNGLALTASSSSTATEASYTGASNQLWTLTASGTGFIIKNNSYGTVIDCPTINSVTNLVLDAASGAKSQIWVLTSYSAS